jgi:transcriptional regulator
VRHTPSFTLQDPQEIKRLIRENPWGTFVASTSAGLTASHYPIVLDETREEISVLSHVGRPDETILELGSGNELMLIVQGPHGYISPGWYDAKPAVPTWNFVVAHLTGVPEILSDEDNLRVLGELVDHFEDRMPEPRRMNGTLENAEYAQRISSGTVGLRLTPTRITAKSKLSQNRPDETVDVIIDQLEGDGPYAQPALAAEMRRVHEIRRAAKAARG